MKLDSFSILVNTPDGYHDRWELFFNFFKKYLPDCNVPIYLNTGIIIWKSTEFPNLISLCSEKDVDQRMSWSKYLLHVLDATDIPLVLYFYVDYFLDNQVRSEIVNRAALYMLNNPEVDNISLQSRPIYASSGGPVANYFT